MKEYEKLLFEDTKRKEFKKALDEVSLGLFEQKQETELDFNKYTLMTYQKKYKGLYDLYQDKETLELIFVCPLVENNKGDESEKVDMPPYAYDVLYLEYLDSEAYELVKKAAIHEKSKLIDIFYILAFVLYGLLITLCVVAIVITLAVAQEITSFLLICAPIISSVCILTALLPILAIKYRKFKAQ